MANYSRLLKTLLIILGICIGGLFTLFLIFYFTVEFGGKWSEEKRQQFAEECAKTTTIDNLNIYFKDFDYHEVDTVLVKQIHDSKCIDSFFVYVNPKRDRYDSTRNYYGIYIDKPMLITDSYHFVVPNVQTFILSDMEMVMWPQYTMFSEGWGCRMGNYMLDSVRFEHNSNPVLIKNSLE